MYVNLLVFRNSKQRLSLLHHIYLNVPGVIILPVAYEDMYFLHVKSSSMENVLKETVLELQRSMEEEVCLAKTFLEKLMDENSKIKNDEKEIPEEESTYIHKTDVYKEFRNKLADIEKKTDLLYFKAKCHSSIDDADNIMLMDVSS